MQEQLLTREKQLQALQNSPKFQQALEAQLEASSAEAAAGRAALEGRLKALEARLAASATEAIEGRQALEASLQALIRRLSAHAGEQQGLAWRAQGQ